MHYKNGREAKNGDKVILLPSYGPPVAGILYDAIPGNDLCNGRIAITSQSDPCPNLKECLHVDDVGAIEVQDPTYEQLVAQRDALAANVKCLEEDLATRGPLPPSADTFPA